MEFLLTDLQYCAIIATNKNRNLRRKSFMSGFRKIIPVVSGILFLLANIICVSSAWILGIHQYDFGISFSAYVGLFRVTSVLYFIIATLFVPMLAYYITKTKINLLKRIVYVLILICILATAFFPFNTFSDTPTAMTINLHNSFAIILMLLTTLSFILTCIFTRIRKRRTVSAFSIFYAIMFVLFYFIGFTPLFQTFFIWENLFVFLLLIELHMEQYEDNMDSSSQS